MTNREQEPRLAVQELVVPGVELEHIPRKREHPFRTGVPAFLGCATKGSINKPKMLTDWSQFKHIFGTAKNNTFLAIAVRGFFENGGQTCYVVRLDDKSELEKALSELESLDAIDLICAPDIMQKSKPIEKRDLAAVQDMQMAILDHCDRLGDRFAILDALPDADVETVLRQREKLSSSKNKNKNGALYYPWVQVPNLDQKENIWVPACGHVAGIYARSDQRVGVHKAPANEELEGVQDLQVQLTHADIKRLNPQGVNCLRAFPGRGIRVWGARTLSQEPNWRYVSVRRLFLTIARWLERFMIKITFEPNDERLRARIVRELTFYFERLFLQGALKGDTAEQAFYVKCDAENNPPDVSDAGIVVTEIGLAPTIPSEFIVVRITHNESGVSIVPR